jgi:hypothetical protein
MQHCIPLTDDPNTGSKRTCEVRGFDWQIFNDRIMVSSRNYYTKKDGSFCTTPIPFEKILTVDDTDYINLDNGQIVLGDEYNSKNVTTEDGTVSNPTYPNVVGQYTAMMNLTIGALKAQGMPIDDTTKVSDILLALIDQNIQTSDQQNHKFDQ